MNVILIGGGALVALLVMYQLLRKADLRKVVRSIRWIVGAAAGLLTGFLLLRGQVGIASVTGYAAYSILRMGRLGPLSFEPSGIGESNESAVTSRYIAMTLDHDSGEVSGRVLAGRLRGSDLMELGEMETRQLLDEVGSDPDSLALLETWLDKNRAGWREYLAGNAGGSSDAGPDDEQQAYEILGLQPGATVEEINTAHRTLMKGVHPDQGGSTFLAAKINQARDLLLKKLGG